MSVKPNLLFILNDHQAYYGHGMQGGVKPMRPNFERFAAAGMEFNNAYCVAPMCGPARRSLLTGLYPHTTGQIHNETNPPFNHEVYLDTLHEKGYKNYYYGKWHAGEGCAYDHFCEGFSVGGSYGNPYNTPQYKEYLKRKGLPRAEHYIEKVIERDGLDSFFKKLKEGVQYKSEDTWCGEHAVGITTTPKETHESFFLANLACEQLEEYAKGDQSQPFSMRVDFWGPHQPFFPTQEFADMYNPADIEPYPTLYSDLAGKPNVVKEERNRPMGDGHQVISPSPLSLQEWQHMFSRCYAQITMIDAAGGMVLDKLKELGLDENTLIVWSTDHGDSLGAQGGHFDKGSNMMQEVMRIPLAIAWKDRIKPNQQNNSLVYTNDIPVTLMDGVGLSFRDKVHGRSLLDLAMPGRLDIPWRDSLMCETYGHGYGVTIRGRMFVKDNYKYVCTENDLDELYDLENDPYETRNLVFSPEFDVLKDSMRRLLNKSQKENDDPLPLRIMLPDNY